MEMGPCFCVLGDDARKQFCDGEVECFMSTCLGRIQRLLEFGECFVARVPIPRIGWQMQEYGDAPFDALLRSICLVTAEMVHSHHVAIRSHYARNFKLSNRNAIAVANPSQRLHFTAPLRYGANFYQIFVGRRHPGIQPNAHRMCVGTPGVRPSSFFELSETGI